MPLLFDGLRAEHSNEQTIGHIKTLLVNYNNLVHQVKTDGNSLASMLSGFMSLLTPEEKTIALRLNNTRVALNAVINAQIANDDLSASPETL